MEKIKTQLTNLWKRTTKEIGNRERYIMKKPEAWQDSEAGLSYMEKTEALRELNEQLAETVNYCPNI